MTAETRGPVTNLVVAERLDESVCLLKPAVHEQSDADGETSEDLLVLGLLRVGDHVLYGGLRLRAELDEPHGDAGGLAGDCVILKLTG